MKSVRWVVGFCLLVIGGLWLFTDYPVQMQVREDRTFDKFVWGATSHANVLYTDYRRILKNDKVGLMDLWYGVGVEWRRLDRQSNDIRRPYSETVAVLRNSTSVWNGGSVALGNRFKVPEPFQAQYDEVRRAYESQTIFDRVWFWKLNVFY